MSQRNEEGPEIYEQNEIEIPANYEKAETDTAGIHSGDGLRPDRCRSRNGPLQKIRHRCRAAARIELEKYSGQNYPAATRCRAGARSTATPYSSWAQPREMRVREQHGSEPPRKRHHNQPHPLECRRSRRRNVARAYRS